MLTLLTDFGTQDAYVAQMKGQMLCINSGLQFVDITHEVPAQDIFAGAFLLSQAVPYFPAGSFHLAVVDPGVGTDRPMIAVEVLTKLTSDEPASLQRLVLPDNGLITFLLKRHRLVCANYLTEPRFWRRGFSYTFHGRDIMGPVIAHWAKGAERSEFGPQCNAPITLKCFEPESQGDAIVARVMYQDHFGNILTNITREGLSQFIIEFDELTMTLEDGRRMKVPLVDTYGQAESGQLVLLFGSHGYLELARAGGNAAADLSICRGNKLRFTTG